MADLRERDNIYFFCRPRVGSPEEHERHTEACERDSAPSSSR